MAGDGVQWWGTCLSSVRQLVSFPSILNFKHCKSQTELAMLVISALGRLRQENCELEDSLSTVVSSMLSFGHMSRPYLKKQTERDQNCGLLQYVSNIPIILITLKAEAGGL